MAGRSERPAVFVSQSAIGYYADAGDEVLTEASPAGTGFLAELVGDWEAAARPAADAGIRTVTARSGLVLTWGDGLLGRLLIPFRLGVGGRLGAGRQWWSWVTLDDWLRAIGHLLGSDLDGPVNVTAHRELVVDRAGTRDVLRPERVADPRPVREPEVGGAGWAEGQRVAQRARPRPGGCHR